MGKIEIITPLHISSGDKKICYKNNNYLYDFDKLIEFLYRRVDDIKDISDKIAELDEKTMQEDIVKKFNIPLYALTNDSKIYLDEKCSTFAGNSANLLLTQKSLNKLIIPGSSIRGWLNNLFLYYFIDKNNYIKEYLSDNMNQLSNQINKITKTIGSLKQIIKIEDIIVDNNPMVFDVKRYKYRIDDKNKDTIPIGNVETIPMNIVVNTNLLDISIKDKTQYFSKIKEESLNNISNNNSFENEMLKKCIEDYCYFITNLPKVLPEINKRFMLYVINKEKEFINNQTNPNVKTGSLLKFYDQILERLSNNEIIFQLGKFTNYFDKSMGFVFGYDYEKNFVKYFKPGDKTTKPVIRSMNLINIGQEQFPLGFIKIEL